VSKFIVLLNQKKVRKIQKISTEKTIPYPGFEHRISGLAVDSLNHCIIGSVKYTFRGKKGENNPSKPKNGITVPNTEFIQVN
jgi:hypothetical protein